MQAALDQHIECTPGVRGGKPRVAGTRITVNDVVLWHLILGMSAEQIAGDYHLTLAAVYAALAYYYDHREEIDLQMAQDEAFAEQFFKDHPSVLKTKMETYRHG